MVGEERALVVYLSCEVKHWVRTEERASSKTVHTMLLR